MRYKIPNIFWNLIFLSASPFVLAESATKTNNNFYDLSLAELGQIDVSIATGNSTPIDKAPASASVISAAEIDAMGAKNLDEILETLPGLHVSLSSLSRLDAVYSIRGIHTGFNSQVLLLINGVAVQSSLQGGRFTLLRLPAANINRIEIIRGPGSAIYGADAYAGVINIITKDSQSISGTQIHARSGSFNSHDLSLQSATDWQGLGLALSMNYLESEGDQSRRVDSDLQTVLDSVIGTKASRAPAALSTRYQILDTRLAITSEQLQLNLWNWRSTNAGLGAGAAQALDPAGKDDSNLFMTDATYQLGEWSENWSNSIRASYLHYTLQSQFYLLPAGTVLPIGNDGNLSFAAPAGIVQFPNGLIGKPGGTINDKQLDFISLFNGWDSQRIRFAIGTRQQNFTGNESKNFGPGVINGTQSSVDGSLTDVTHTTNIYLADSSRTLNYLSLQDEWSLATDLTLTLGLRYDHYSDFGNTTNPRIALVWATNEKLTTKLLYGSAFRAPSFSELYFKNNPVSLGNPTLKPENINTIEASFNYRFTSDLQTTLTLFDYESKDMIEFIPDTNNPTTKTAQNARDQKGKGFEFEFNWKPTTQLHIRSSYSLQDSQDTKTHHDIADAPKQQFKINTDWEFRSQWFLNGQVDYVGNRKRAADDNRPDIANYTLLNLTLKRDNILPKTDLSFTLRNATDTKAREPSSGDKNGSSIPQDYLLESRSAWLTLNFSFQ